jgi:hypothetical protein
MSIVKRIEEMIAHLIFTERNIDNWEEYEMNIIRNFNSINFQNIIENYKPLPFRKLYISRFDMSEILYKNIILNDNLFIELFKNGYYPRKECDFTGNDIWGLVEKCVHILVEKQMGQNYNLNILVKYTHNPIPTKHFDTKSK